MTQPQSALANQPAAGTGGPFQQDSTHDGLPPKPAPREKSRFFAVAAWTTLILGIVSAVLWPGAVCFHWDEAFLIGQAFFFNQAHRLAHRGLGGNFGIPYGPFPTQCYQLLLLFTHDLRVVAFCRAFISSSMMAGSLLWLARTLRLTPWFATAIVLAPFLNWTERAMWDATFAIPISVLAVAAYASFLRTRSRWSLAVAVGAATLDPLIHMQGLPLFFAIAGHAIWRQRRELLRSWFAVAVPLAILIALNAGYFRIFFEVFVSNVRNMFRYGYPGRTGGIYFLQSLAGPFLAGSNLSGENWVVPRHGLPGPPTWVGYAMTASYLVYPLIWLGMIGSVVAVIRQRAANRGQPEIKSSALPASAPAVRDTITRIALAALALQIALGTSLRVPAEPQYSFGTYGIHILFAWFGVELLRRIWLGHLATVIYGAAVGYLTLGGGWSIHRYGWDRGLLSPSLDNQMEIARQLNRYADTTVWTEVDNYQRFPRDIQTLRLLNPPAPGVARIRSPHGLFIRYEHNDNPRTFRVELFELGPEFRSPFPAVLEDAFKFVSPGAAMAGRPPSASLPTATEPLDVTLPKPLY
jgi:hypothetical protein